MTFIATVDTPWLSVIEGGESVNTPKLPADPAFEADILGWADITGAQGEEVEPGVVLYGGNYAKVTGIQPDYPSGRLGGSGDPDYLMIEIKVENESTLQSIDQQDDYWVYWDDVTEEEGPVTVAATYKPRGELPSQTEFGEWRARLARRGIPQEWINEVFGTGNSKTRGENDINARRGYLLNQYNNVSLIKLAVYLEKQGWDVVGSGAIITVHDNDEAYEATVDWLLGCDYSGLNNEPLENDICMGMQEQGFCEEGCQ